MQATHKSILLFFQNLPKGYTKAAQSSLQQPFFVNAPHGGLDVGLTHRQVANPIAGRQVTDQLGSGGRTALKVIDHTQTNSPRWISKLMPSTARTSLYSPLARLRSAPQKPRWCL